MWCNKGVDFRRNYAFYPVYTSFHNNKTHTKHNKNLFSPYPPGRISFKDGGGAGESTTTVGYAELPDQTALKWNKVRISFNAH